MADDFRPSRARRLAGVAAGLGVGTLLAVPAYGTTLFGPSPWGGW